MTTSENRQNIADERSREWRRITGEVRRLKSKGNTNIQIAEFMGLDENTVRQMLGLSPEERSFAVKLGKLAKDLEPNPLICHLKSYLLMAQEQGFTNREQCRNYWNGLTYEERFNLMRRALGAAK